MRPTFLKLSFYFDPPYFIAGFKFLFPVYFLLLKSSTKCFRSILRLVCQYVYINCMLPSTSRRDRDGNASLAGMAGWSKKKVAGSGMDKAYVRPSVKGSSLACDERVRKILAHTQDLEDT